MCVQSHTLVAAADDTDTMWAVLILAFVAGAMAQIPTPCCKSMDECSLATLMAWLLARLTDCLNGCLGILVGWLKCCFTSRETVGLLGAGAQDVHLYIGLAINYMHNRYS